MSEAGFITVVFLIVGAVLLAFLYALVTQSRRRAALTEEEWEQRERGANLLGASVMAVDQILRPEMKAGIERLHDDLRGQTEDRKQSGGQTQPPED